MSAVATTCAVPLDLSLSPRRRASRPGRRALPTADRGAASALLRLPAVPGVVDQLDRAAAGELALREVGVMTIGGSADYQAVWLREEKGGDAAPGPRSSLP